MFQIGLDNFLRLLMKYNIIIAILRGMLTDILLFFILCNIDVKIF